MPLQHGLEIKKIRQLGDGILAYTVRERKEIYFHDQKKGRILSLRYFNDREDPMQGRVIAQPVYKLESEQDKIEYAQFLYNVLAKIHNATGRTPKVWDSVLTEMVRNIAKNGEAQSLLIGEVAKWSEKSMQSIKTVINQPQLAEKPLFPFDLPQLVELIHFKRKTIPPSKEMNFSSEKTYKKSLKVAFLYDTYEPLTIPLLGRMKESLNLSPEFIFGNDKKGIAPYALWRNLNHGDYGKIYKDSSWYEIQSEAGVYGYVLLNGKKVWVFKNLAQMEQLKELNLLPKEVEQTEIDLLLGARIQITVDKDSETQKTIKESKVEKQLRKILGCVPIRTYSQVSLFENPGPYHMVVDPFVNLEKVDHAEDQHFKAPHSAPRLVARLVDSLNKFDSLRLNSIPSIRLDSQLYQASPLDKGNRKGQQNAMIPFTAKEKTQFGKQFADLFKDFSIFKKVNASEPDYSRGKKSSDKTSSMLEVVFEMAPGAENATVTESLIKAFLKEVSKKGFLHLYDYPIMGQHVRQQAGMHLSFVDGIKVTSVKGSQQNNYKIALEFWFDRDWEEAGELLRLAESVGFLGLQEIEKPEGNFLEAERDKIRDFLFKRGVIPPARRIFPHVEFAPEPAAGILEAPYGRIGRVFLYSVTENLASVQQNDGIPEYQIGNFNIQIVGMVGPSKIEDVALPLSADGTYGKWDEMVEFGRLDPKDSILQDKEVNFNDVLGWLTINGSEKIYLIRGRERGSSHHLNREKIPYGSIVPLLNLSPKQIGNFFLFAASGSDIDIAGKAMESGVIKGDAMSSGTIKKVLVPAPWKKINPKKEAEKKESDKSKVRLFINGLRDVRNMWRLGSKYSPGSCTTNCAIFAVLLNELMFNLSLTKKGGVRYFSQKLQHAIGNYFSQIWDDFPREWREDPDKPIRFKLFENGGAVTIHGKTNSQPIRNQAVSAFGEMKPGDAKKLDNTGLNYTTSGVTKAVGWILPNARSFKTDSVRIAQDTGSNFGIKQNVAIYNIRKDLSGPDIKELEKYLSKKMKAVFEYAANYLFNGSLRW